MKINHWLRLIRWKNLLIIALTMYLVRNLVLSFALQDEKYSEWKFVLIVIVMVLLAAAGNIINDYFDIRVDRINKPERVVIGNHIKRRVAMISHQFLNGLAVLIGFYLAYDIGFLILGLIPVFIASLLWLYSVVLKKKTIIGNLSIALLIAIVPIWGGIFDAIFITTAYSDEGSYFYFFWSSTWDNFSTLFLSFAIFGFLLTFIREMQKDIEDLEGDKKVGYQTLPIRFGIKNTKKVIGLIYIVLFVCLFLLFKVFQDLFLDVHIEYHHILIASLILTAPIILSWLLTVFAKTKSNFKTAGNITKLAMLGGLIFLYYFFKITSILYFT